MSNAAYRILAQPQTLTLVLGTSTTVISQVVNLNGILLAVDIKTAAAVDGAATTKVDIINAAGINVWTKSSIAVNTNAETLLTNDQRVPLSGSYTITVTFSGAQSVARSTIVTPLIDRG